MKKRTSVLCLVLLLAVTTGSSQNLLMKPTLTIGDPAPSFDAYRWLKGKPVNKFEKGHVYVVEFWATWCVPCNKAMPHLSELARQYRGQVTIIGADVRESKKGQPLDLAALQSFVDKKGKDMDYAVAIDDPATEKIFNSWMGAAGLNGIPATFVIDREGKIAWIGHPDELEPVLKEIVYSPEQFNRDLASEAHNKDFLLNFMYKAATAVNKMIEEKNYGLAWQEVKKIKAAYPEFETTDFWLFIRPYLNYNSDSAIAYVKERSKDMDFLKAIGYKDEKTAADKLLRKLAGTIAFQEGLNPEAYYMAVGYLEKGVEEEPENSNLWGALAQLYANLNEPAKAVAMQQKALEVLNSSMSADSGNNFQVLMLKSAKDRLNGKLEAYKNLQKKREAAY